MKQTAARLRREVTKGIRHDYFDFYTYSRANDDKHNNDNEYNNNIRNK